MKEPYEFEYRELARVCTMDIGREVTAAEVRGYLLGGAAALGRFSDEERSDIQATLFKELDAV